jgi:hypothetical protein
MRKHGKGEAGSRWGKASGGVLAMALGISALSPISVFAWQHGQPGHAAPGPAHYGQPAGRPQGGQQPHLGAWLERHGNLSPQEQERALQHEPGFNRLPPETQERLMGRLQQLNRMPPAQRQRMTDRIEAMERMSPQMRQQVKSSVMEFRSMPADRQLMMRKAFRDLREFPPEQRQAMMSSGRFQAQFTPQERNILGNMLAVEPYRGPGSGAGVGYAPYGH